MGIRIRGYMHSFDLSWLGEMVSATADPETLLILIRQAFIDDLVSLGKSSFNVISLTYTN